LFSIVAFKTLDISQGSIATQLRCGGIFIANFLLIQQPHCLVTFWPQCLYCIGLVQGICNSWCCKP